MKFRLTARWYGTGVDDTIKENEPVGDLIIKMIDTKIDGKYDGCETVEDVKKMFLQCGAQDPLHSVVLRVDACVPIG